MSCSRRPRETRRSSAGTSKGLRRSRLERGAGRRCLQTGSGCSRCAGRTWSCCRPGLARWSRCRRETWCGSRSGRGSATRSGLSSPATPADNKPRGYIQEIPAGIPRAITPEGVVLAGRAAARDGNSILGRARRHLDALSDSGRRWPARSGAHAWRYPASMEPRRPIRVYRRQHRVAPGRQPSMSFAWSWRPAAGLSGRLSRRPTPWESKT